MLISLLVATPVLLIRGTSGAAFGGVNDEAETFSATGLFATHGTVTKYANGCYVEEGYDDINLVLRSLFATRKARPSLSVL